MTKRIIFSGVRPTGKVHLGNYLGAIKNWQTLSKEEGTYLFCIVDQHALTTTEDSTALKENTILMAATYIACGIDPFKNHIFVQSSIPEHTELAWYLGCMTPLGWLNRMTQFKDKAGKNKESAHLGLYAYPVLMASDILLYGTTHVPVGEDQKQHVELTRDIAQAFNNNVQQSIFTLPEPVILKESARIMSLRDGRVKMSKSDLSDYSRIHLMDTNDEIALKIRKAKTDSLPITGSLEDLDTRFEAKNLLNMYAVLTDSTLLSTCLQFEGRLFSDVKNDLTDVLIQTLSPIRQKLTDLLTDKKFLDDILKQGTLHAKEQAEKTLSSVKKSLKMYRF